MALTKEQKEKAVIAIISIFKTNPRGVYTLVDELDKFLKPTDWNNIYSIIKTDVDMKIEEAKVAIDDEAALRKANLDSSKLGDL